jgi:hypothetical protein
MTKRLKRPRDPLAVANLIGDIATGQVEDKQHDDGKNPAAVALGRLGGAKGGKARAASMTAAQRRPLQRRLRGAR